MNCPFCKSDPFHYEDNGVCMEPVAVVCCDIGVDLYSRDPKANRIARKIMELRQSGSVRRLIRSDALLLKYYDETRQTRQKPIEHNPRTGENNAGISRIY